MVVKSSNSKDGKPYRVVELFSGIGAQHMALERAGLPYQIVGICDIDPYAVQAYEAIHGPAPMLGETTDKAGRRIGDVTRIQHLPKDVDILTYSFPCTDLSQAHLHGKGLKGEHSGLLWAVGDILEQAEKDGRLPRYLIMENVPQVFSAKNRKDWDAWMDFLATLGYTSKSGLLNAKDFPGTGQNRNRAFMISHLGTECPPLPIAPGGDTVLADVLEGDVDPKYYLNKTRVDGMKKSTAKEKGRGNGFKFKPLDPETSVSHAITMREGQRKTSNFVRDPTRCKQAGTVEGMSGYDSLKRVYSPDGVSPTIVAKKGGNTEAKVLEGKSDIRKLTPKEAWRLQSFGRRKRNGEWDDSAYEKAAATGLSDGRLYGMAGNSINVNVFTPILKSIDRFDVETDGGRKGQKTMDNWNKSRSVKARKSKR